MSTLLIQNLTDVSVGEWQREYLYKVSILQIPSGMSGNLPAGFNPDLLDLYCNTIPFPETKVKEIEQKWAGQRDFWAGTIDTSGEIEGTFRFDEPGRAYDFFHTWRQLAGKDESAAQVPKWMYIGSLKFSLYSVDKETLLKSWAIKRAWVNEISTLETDKTKEGILTFKAKLKYGERALLSNP
jgi:hypothetical protein